MAATAAKEGTTTKARQAAQAESVTITRPDMRIAAFRIVGSEPYVQNAFGAKARTQMREKQAAGSTANKNRKRDPKDFEALYREAMHVSEDGWNGIPASAFRAAAISACRLVGFKMTLAKLSVFILADGRDKNDGTPLVRITRGEPRYTESLVRNETGVPDIRPRPLWDAGWEATVRVRYDAAQFTAQDVANLMMRVGSQIGIGEGRPDSSNSAGMGWGLFEVK